MAETTPDKQPNVESFFNRNHEGKTYHFKDNATKHYNKPMNHLGTLQGSPNFLVNQAIFTSKLSRKS